MRRLTKTHFVQQAMVFLSSLPYPERLLSTQMVHWIIFQVESKRDMKMATHLNQVSYPTVC